MIDFIATSTFGLEACVKREITKLGFENIKTFDGRVEFTGDESAIPKANLWLRCAGRVYIKMGEFKALSFEDLFQGTKALPWGDWIPVDGKFTVVGKSVKSALHSVPDCQAIVKKAIVEKLKTYVAAGNTAVVTSGFLKACEAQGIREMTSLSFTGRKAAGREYWADVFQAGPPAAYDGA